MSLSDTGTHVTQVVAIDGPAGSGKSTIARLTARALGFAYMDTGAMYRAITLAALQKGIDPGDAIRLSKLAEESTITFNPRPDASQHVYLNGADVTTAIRMPDVTTQVSEVSNHQGVRQALVAHQRELAGAAAKGAVVEGRDVGTVVFPQATLKVYLDASVKERARRRQKDMQAAGIMINQSELVKLLKKRDEKDASRLLSPLAKADDAVVVDTTDMTIDEAVGFVVRLTQEREGQV